MDEFDEMYLSNAVKAFKEYYSTRDKRVARSKKIKAWVPEDHPSRVCVSCDIAKNHYFMQWKKDGCGGLEGLTIHYPN